MLQRFIRAITETLKLFHHSANFLLQISTFIGLSFLSIFLNKYLLSIISIFFFPIFGKSKSLKKLSPFQTFIIQKYFPSSQKDNNNSSITHLFLVIVSFQDIL